VSSKLLDTNIALFALGAPGRLSVAAKTALETGPNLLSVVSYWEVTLKCAKGALDIDDPELWWQDALVRLTATPLLLRPEHVSGVNRLPMYHKDPFDRVLIAQATVENLTLVTSDRDISRYASQDLKIIR
jgi:PIN domain nuclease of toxin-antitoxin system